MSRIQSKLKYELFSGTFNFVYVTLLGKLRQILKRLLFGDTLTQQSVISLTSSLTLAINTYYIFCYVLDGLPFSE